MPPIAMSAADDVAVEEKETEAGTGTGTGTGTAAVGSSLGRMNRAISNPGSVKINVEGAFIVDDEPVALDGASYDESIHFERKDIRLPKHTGVVSHVAVDVSSIAPRSAPHLPTPFLSTLHRAEWLALRGDRCLCAYDSCRCYRSVAL